MGYMCEEKARKGKVEKVAVIAPAPINHQAMQVTGGVAPGKLPRVLFSQGTIGVSQNPCYGF